MKKIFGIVLLIGVLSSCGGQLYNEKMIQETIEIGYFKGQMDAIQNKICISINENKEWIWTKSPWGNERGVIFNPLDTKYRGIINGKIKQ